MNTDFWCESGTYCWITAPIDCGNDRLAVRRRFSGKPGRTGDGRTGERENGWRENWVAPLPRAAETERTCRANPPLAWDDVVPPSLASGNPSLSQQHPPEFRTLTSPPRARAAVSGLPPPAFCLLAPPAQAGLNSRAPEPENPRPSCTSNRPHRRRTPSST
jgi:hypothetical protein